ncbi:MAG: T9SS type A sorting domain-containing protein [bacterium]|nr:T9SS type A sorting domain-containing protein [bacterium]
MTGMVEGDPENAWEVPFQNLGGGQYSAVDPNRDVGSGDTYIYRLYLAEGDAEWSLVDEFQLVSSLIEEEEIEIPTFAGIRDFKAWPNPFNPMTTISFRLGQAQRTRLAIFGPDGSRIAVLADRQFGAGEQAQTWDGRDFHGSTVSSGTYIVVIEGETERQTQKITLLK